MRTGRQRRWPTVTGWPPEEEGLAEADGDGVADGVAGGAFGATSSTWRNCSSAVRLTCETTVWALWPGTDTVMTSLPCCSTWASVKPALFTRLFMIWIACCISADAGVPPPGLTACSATVVPLVRSRPR